MYCVSFYVVVGNKLNLILSYDILNDISLRTLRERREILRMMHFTEI